MDAIEIPGWVLSNVGGFVGFVIFSVVFLKCHRKKREQASTQKERDRHDEERLLDRLLPGPWRTLYEFLLGCPEMARHSVLLVAKTFERDVSDIPTICPAGFDRILEVSYYNLGETGNCHEEFVGILGHHVKFPKTEKTACKEDIHGFEHRHDSMLQARVSVAAKPDW